MLFLFSERRGRKGKQIWGEKWRREISCTERRLKDCKSRWEETSRSRVDLLHWAGHFSVVIVSHRLSQIAQLERKEPVRKNHSVDSAVTGKQLNCCDRRLYVFMRLYVSLTLCGCWQAKRSKPFVFKVLTWNYFWVQNRKHSKLFFFYVLTV